MHKKEPWKELATFLILGALAVPPGCTIIGGSGTFDGENSGTPKAGDIWVKPTEGASVYITMPTAVAQGDHIIWGSDQSSQNNPTPPQGQPVKAYTTPRALDNNSSNH